MAAQANIPERKLYKSAEVCSIAGVQAYVLRSWEAEFPSLGQSTNAGVRVYRKSDIERVLEIKRLLFTEGLTLGAARRQLSGEEESTDVSDVGEPALGDFLPNDARECIAEVKRGLETILAMLSPHDDMPVGAGPNGSGPASITPSETGDVAGPRVKKSAAKTPLLGEDTEGE